MDLSNISHMFHVKHPFAEGKQACKQPGQPAAASSDLLQQISSEIISKKEGASKTDSFVKAQEVKLDIIAKKAPSLEDQSEGALDAYFHLTRLFRNLSAGRERDLIDFKERLQEMDKTIQGYQDILDGKAALPKGMIEITMKGIAQRLAKAKQSREQFMQKGLEELNRWGSLVGKDGSHNFTVYLENILGENKFEGKGRSAWVIDPTADDLYSEIDRVLEETCSLTKELERGMLKVYREFVRRGLGEKYKRYLDTSCPKESTVDKSDAKYIEQKIQELLRHGPLYEAEKVADLPHGSFWKGGEAFGILDKSI